MSVCMYIHTYIHTDNLCSKFACSTKKESDNTLYYVVKVYVCPHTTVPVSAYSYVCTQTTAYVSAFYCMCVLMLLLYMCPHTTIYTDNSSSNGTYASKRGLRSFKKEP